MDRRPLLILSGTTASGKNACGTLLAEALNGEVISLDSMKVYRGLDIGTDKPSRELCERVPHHLVDILDPQEEMNLSRFVERAHEAVVEIRSRDRLPIVVGGTALYLTGFLKGVLEGPDADPEFRGSLREEAERIGVHALHQRLREVDKEAAERIHPNDYKRIERALEVQATTGSPISELQGQWKRPSLIDHRLFLLVWPRDLMNRRINLRVEQMFAGEFLEEVKGLLEGGGLGKVAAQAIGYPEAIACLRGEIDRDEAIERTQRNTRRFAKRQLTWFRKMTEATWIEAEEGDDVSEISERILTVFNGDDAPRPS